MFAFIAAEKTSYAVAVMEGHQPSGVLPPTRTASLLLRHAYKRSSNPPRGDRSGRAAKAGIALWFVAPFHQEQKPAPALTALGLTMPTFRPSSGPEKPALLRIVATVSA